MSLRLRERLGVKKKKVWSRSLSVQRLWNAQTQINNTPHLYIVTTSERGVLIQVMSVLLSLRLLKFSRFLYKDKS